MRILTIALSFVALAPLAAQTAAAAPSAAPHITVETVGPEGWRARLGPTNLGSLLASAQARELWEPISDQWFESWQRATGGGEGFAAARGRLLGYAGRVRVETWIGERGPERMAMVLESDGRIDMKALAADLRTLATPAGAEWGVTEHGSEKVDTLAMGDSRTSAPLLAGEHVVVAIAPVAEFGATLDHARRLAAAATGKPPLPTTPALQIDVDIAALVAKAKEFGRGDAEEAIEVLGYASLARVQASIATAGPHVTGELAMRFAPTPAGLLAAFYPPVDTLPTLARGVAADDTSWRVGPFDFDALYAAILKFAVELGSEDPREEMKAELGIDLGPDLIAHMATETLFVSPAFEALDRPDDFTWALAIKLRNAKAFSSSLDTLLEKAKPMLTRSETTPIEGVDCHRYGNMMNYPLWVAVGHDTFFLAGGRDAEARLGIVIGAVKAGAEAPAKAADAAFADLARHLPPGLNAKARMDLGGLFGLPRMIWGELLGEVLPGEFGNPTWTEEDQERVHELLRKNNLLLLRSASGYANSTWRWRVFW
jgi:hypothetical protein